MKVLCATGGMGSGSTHLLIAGLWASAGEATASRQAASTTPARAIGQTAWAERPRTRQAAFVRASGPCASVRRRSGHLVPLGWLASWCRRGRAGACGPLRRAAKWLRPPGAGLGANCRRPPGRVGRHGRGAAAGSAGPGVTGRPGEICGVELSTPRAARRSNVGGAGSRFSIPCWPESVANGPPGRSAAIGSVAEASGRAVAGAGWSAASPIRRRSRAGASRRTRAGPSRSPISSSRPRSRASRRSQPSNGTLLPRCRRMCGAAHASGQPLWCVRDRQPGHSRSARLRLAQRRNCD